MWIPPSYMRLATTALKPFETTVALDIDDDLCAATQRCDVEVAHPHPEPYSETHLGSTATAACTMAPPVARAKKRPADPVDSDANPSSLHVGRLDGATLSLFYDHHGWCEGVVKRAVGLDCKVVFPERDTSGRMFEEDVTLPDDTIRVVRWGDGSPATGAWAAAAISPALVSSAPYAPALPVGARPHGTSSSPPSRKKIPKKTSAASISAPGLATSVAAAAAFAPRGGVEAAEGG
jgi:hypothetical protein